MRIMKLLAVTALFLWPGVCADAITRYTATVIPGVERGSYGKTSPLYFGLYYASMYSPRCGLNDLGQVAGQTRALVGGVEQRHAALWDPQDGMRDLAPGDPRQSLALDVNDQGQVVGNVDISPLPHSQYGGYRYQGFLWQDGVMTELGALGGLESYAVKVNESGQVVGSFVLTPGSGHAFLWDANSGMRDLGTLGGYDSLAMDINDLGQVVGMADAQGYTRAFLWQDGVMTDILGGQFQGAGLAINNRGQVAGMYYNDAAHVNRAFVWDAQSGMRDIGSLSGDDMYPLAINNLGQIVGWDANYQRVEPFIWEDGVMMNLNDLIEPGVAPRVSRALAINDRGQILADRGNGGLVLLTPIPEPSSLAALAFGLAPVAVAALGRKRKQGNITSG